MNIEKKEAAAQTLTNPYKIALDRRGFVDPLAACFSGFILVYQSGLVVWVA
jgi:hypothetical protein